MTERRLAWFDNEASPLVKQYGAHIHPGGGPDGQPVNSVLSLTDQHDLHMPLLDDDGGFFRVIPSGTTGHQHVYIDKAITWDQMQRLLRVLAECALVDPKWAEASIAQGTSTLRLPSNPKVAV